MLFKNILQTNNRERNLNLFFNYTGCRMHGIIMTKCYLGPTFCKFTVFLRVIKLLEMMRDFSINFKLIFNPDWLYDTQQCWFLFYKNCKENIFRATPTARAPIQCMFSFIPDKKMVQTFSGNVSCCSAWMKLYSCC